MRPKILVGGLTAVLEAWHDERGDSGGIVSTWVLWPREDSPDAMRLLLATLNGATLSRLYMSRYGGRSMSGRQTTIHKQSLSELPLPADLFEPIDAGAPDAMLNWPTEHATRAARNSLKRLLIQSATALQAIPDDDQLWRQLDRLAHLTAARLFGRSMKEAEADYQWWCERTRQSVVVDDPASLVRKLAATCRETLKLAPPSKVSTPAA